MARNIIVLPLGLIAVVIVAALALGLIGGMVQNIKIWVQGATPGQVQKLREDYPDAEIVILEPQAVPAPPNLPPNWGKGHCSYSDNSLKKGELITMIRNNSGSFRFVLTAQDFQLFISQEGTVLRIAKLVQGAKNTNIFEIDREVFLHFLGSSSRRSASAATSDALANAIAKAGSAPGWNVVYTAAQIIEWLGAMGCK